MSIAPDLTKQPALTADPKPDGGAALLASHPAATAAGGETGAFVSDEATAEAVAAAFEEQGVPGNVATGGVAAAIEHLGSAASPRLLVVDLANAADPMHEIDALAEVCDPGTSVIAIGTANDVTLFRDLLAAGVADYLIKPVSSEAIGQAVVNALHHQQRAEAGTGPDLHAPGKLIAFIGARGGVGASSMAINCASIIAQEQGRRVALVDLDLQFGTMALALDIDAGRGLREALENPARIDSLFVTSVAVTVGTNLSVFAAEEPLDGPLTFDPEALELLLAELRQSFDCVILDVPRALAVSQWHMLSTTDTLVVVSDLSLSGLRDTMRLTGIVKSVLPDARLVVVANRAGHDKKGEIPTREFEKSGETKIDFVVPEDAKACGLAANSGKTLLSVAKGAKVTKALRQLSESLVRPKKEAKRPLAWRRLLKG